MNILHIIASADLSHGGPIEHAVRLGQALERRGHRQDFLTIDPPDSPALAEVPATVFAKGRARSPQRHRLFGRLRRWMNYAPDARHWLRDHAAKYDVVVVSGLWNYLTLVASRVLAHGDTPYVVFTHGMLDPWFKRTYRLKSAVKQLLWFVSEGPLLNHADYVLFTCSEERQLARTSFVPYRPRERVVAFGTADVPPHSAAQDAAFRATVPGLGRAYYLLFLSRIHEKKGADLLVKAFAAVTARYPDLHVVIAGPDPQGLKVELQNLATDLGCAEKIHWPGMLKGDEKWGAFRDCEAFILPSHQENFGIVVAEAMACGKPVLLSDKVNIWREVDANGAGFVETDTVSGTERLLTRFLELDDGSRREMGNRARSAFLSQFLMDRAVDDFELMLDEVLQARSAGMASRLASVAGSAA